MSKFWSISSAGASVHVQFERIGTDGQEWKKKFADAGQVRSFVSGRIAEKLAKGYSEVRPR